MAVENNEGVNVTFIFTVSVAASLKKGLLSSKTATDKRLLSTQLKCVFNPWQVSLGKALKPKMLQTQLS